MTRADRALVIILGLVGVGGVLAVVPAVVPLSWLAATHRWLGLGEMPAGPVVEYLARSLSAFYALFGALCLVVISDLERYRPLARLLGWSFVLLGIALFGIDLSAGMPWWWTAIEGPGAVPFGLLLVLLARPRKRAEGGAAANLSGGKPVQP